MLNIEKEFCNINVMCWTVFPTWILDLFGSVIVSYIIVVHVETSFELMKNKYFNSMFLEVAHLK